MKHTALLYTVVTIGAGQDDRALQFLRDHTDYAGLRNQLAQRERQRVFNFLDAREARASISTKAEVQARKALRHSPEMTRVCSPELTRRPGWAGDDNALPTYGLRTKVRRMGWATLTERKWIISGERRGRKATIRESLIRALGGLPDRTPLKLRCGSRNRAR